MDTEKKRESTSHLKKETRVVALNHFPVTVSQGKKEEERMFFRNQSSAKKEYDYFCNRKTRSGPCRLFHAYLIIENGEES